MVEFQDVYDAFLSKILEDSWDNADLIDLYTSDWYQLLRSALPYFKYPRCKLTMDSTGFTDDNFGEAEIQVISTFMKVEWYERNLLCWQNVKPSYDETDFSPANKISKLTTLLERTREKAAELEEIYYRSINGKPYPYNKWAGGKRKK
jgi:hypothetical protein